MGTTEQPPPKEKRAGRRLLVAALLLLAIPACLLRDNDALRSVAVMVWIAACIYLAAKMLRNMTHRIARRRNVEPEAEATPVVEWALGRASSSPSRSEAANKLPEYTTRLLSS